MASCLRSTLDRRTFDVVVIGGGINGAALFHTLSRAGYRVLVVDGSDFGSGTSQGSTMLIWGGLLYLRNLELGTVWRLCASRDRLIHAQPTDVRPATVKWVPQPGGRGRALVQSAVTAYWLMGLGRRARPHFVRDFPERAMLNHGGPRGALSYEEGALEASDARFVLSWILDAEREEAVARNYTRLEHAAFDHAARQWRLDVRDTLDDTTATISARLVINAAGGWTDDLNRSAGIVTPYHHVLSRGVSIAVPRDSRHATHLVFDMPNGDSLTLAPWGPVSLWASTDSVHGSMHEARQIDRRDVEHLLESLNQQLRTPYSMRDIVSVRCGVRPLPARRGQHVQGGAANLTRHHRIVADTSRPWISVFGGKLSGCVGLADEVRARVRGTLGDGHVTLGGERAAEPPSMVSFPGLDATHVDPAWSATHEHCRTLDDYLRRRTNIAQWTPREGFGRTFEHLDRIREIAHAIRADSAADADVATAHQRVTAEWQRLFNC